MAHSIDTRPSLRQLRLLAWLRNPRGDLIEDPAIDWRQASWSAQTIVDKSCIYTTRTQCLHDLNALRARGLVWKWGDTNPAMWQLCEDWT